MLFVLFCAHEIYVCSNNINGIILLSLSCNMLNELKVLYHSECCQHLRYSCTIFHLWSINVDMIVSDFAVLIVNYYT